MNRADTPDFSTRRRLLTLTGLVFCMLLAVSACGQRGPLYLPDKEAESADTESLENDQSEENGEQDEETP